jgi:sarcosine oxidase subunit beta
MSSPVAVVGAGSTGSSTAYHLAKAGVPVILLDSGEIGQGMTSRSTAIVRTFYSNEIVAKMAFYSLKILREFSAVGSSGFTQCGMLVCVPENIKGLVASNVQMLRKLGIREMELSRAEAGKMFPEIDVDDSDYFAFEPESGYADPVATANSFAAKARELGANLQLRSQVERLVIDEGKVSSLILKDGSKISCSKVILCTNVWTNKLLARSGVEEEKLLPIRAVLHPVVVYRRPQEFQGKKPVISDFLNKSYYKPEGQSLLFGGSIDASIDNQTVDPDNYPSDVPFEYVSMFSEKITRRIPSMRKAEYHSSYIGMYDISPDENPILDNLSSLGLEGAFCCVGLSGHGFKLCPAFGIMNTEMILGKEPSDEIFDRSHFSLERFKRGKLMKTKYEGIGTIG